MLVLGLNAGHCATACLAEDGQVVSCVSEERFSRIKNHAGLPLRAVEFVLKDRGVSVGDLDQVVMDNNLAGVPRFVEWYQDRYRRTPEGWRFADRRYHSLARLGEDGTSEVFPFPSP